MITEGCVLRVGTPRLRSVSKRVRGHRVCIASGHRQGWFYVDIGVIKVPGMS